MNIDLDKIKEIVNLSLREDSVKQDITSKVLLNSVEKVKFKITAKENGILCGMPVVKFIYENIFFWVFSS